MRCVNLLHRQGLVCEFDGGLSFLGSGLFYKILQAEPLTARLLPIVRFLAGYEAAAVLPLDLRLVFLKI